MALNYGMTSPTKNVKKMSMHVGLKKEEKHFTVIKTMLK